MLEQTFSELAFSMSGELLDEWASSARFSGNVQTDSREVQPGDAYFARIGQSLDGHDFVLDAQTRGASLVVVQRQLAGIEIPQILVPDTTEALIALATSTLKSVRDRGQLRVAAITGSNGKTSTKSFLAGILSHFGSTVAPKNSFNNEVGTPLTVLQISNETRFLVTELGAAGPGSIERLARWVLPDVGVELKVGHAHVGVFGGLDQTARIKAELIPFTKAALVLNADDERVAAMPIPVGLETMRFGQGSEADFRISDVSVTIRGTSFALRCPDGESHRVQLSVLGEHQVMNATAALLTAKRFGVDIAEAIDVISQLKPPERWRMELLERSDGMRLINDAYNASPESMRAGLQTLATLSRQENLRSVAILGEMAELGEFSIEAHDEIGRLIVRLNIAQLFVIGEAAKGIHLAATQEGSWGGESEFFATTSEAEQAIAERLGSGDLVLVKSSNVAGLRHLGDRLAGVSP